MDNTSSRTVGRGAADPMQRVWCFRWRGGPEQTAPGATAAAAAFSLGYGSDDFKDLTWEERR